MERLENINKVLEELKNGEILTSNGTNLFYLKDNKVRIKDNNSSYYLEIEDFINLYKKTIFTYYKNNETIDENKDEAYYRYYKK